MPSRTKLKNAAIAIPGAFPFEAFEEEIEKLLASPGATQK